MELRITAKSFVSFKENDTVFGRGQILKYFKIVFQKISWGEKSDASGITLISLL